MPGVAVCCGATPFLLRGTRECLLYARDEYAEGLVSHAGRNEVHACVRAALACPLPQKWFEVSYFGGHEYSAFLGSQLQDLRVG